MSRFTVDSSPRRASDGRPRHDSVGSRSAAAAAARRRHKTGESVMVPSLALGSSPRSTPMTLGLGALLSPRALLGDDAAPERTRRKKRDKSADQSADEQLLPPVCALAQA